MKLLDELIDFLFPKTCIVSGELIDENNSNPYISDHNLALLNRITEADKLELNDKTDSDFSISLFAFRENDDFSKIIYQLKYAGMKNLGIFLGNLLGEEILRYYGKNNMNSKDILAPVPLFKSKKRERGYNQSEYICKGINEVLNIDFIPDLLIRIKNTNTQTRLNRHQRQKNVKDAFKINDKFKSVIKNGNVFLIDDVITTGSTINEAIKLLKLHRAGVITACTLAMARD